MNLVQSLQLGLKKCKGMKSLRLTHALLRFRTSPYWDRNGFIRLAKSEAEY